MSIPCNVECENRAFTRSRPRSSYPPYVHLPCDHELGWQNVHHDPDTVTLLQGTGWSIGKKTFRLLIGCMESGELDMVTLFESRAENHPPIP